MVVNLPLPGTMVNLSRGFIPPLLNGLVINPNNPFQFDFILDMGEDLISNEDLQSESDRLIKYFLAALTTPEDEMWVNLSPYEPDRIIPQEFGLTEMGRDMLAQDYILKQLSASIIYPEKEIGKDFWERVYEKAMDRFGTTQIPFNTFNKIWIVPDQAVVFADGNLAFIIETHLKVMLEEDYLSSQFARQGQAKPKKKLAQIKTMDGGISSEILREIIVPEIEKEVNEGEHFAMLRQIFHSAILAKWYKENLTQSILSRKYANQKKILGVDVEDKDVKEKIYKQYLLAFRKGVYNIIKEDYDPSTQEMIPRKYFSGGTSMVIPLTVTNDLAMLNAKKTGSMVKVQSRMQQPKESDPADAAMMTGQDSWRGLIKGEVIDDGVTENDSRFDEFETLAKTSSMPPELFKVFAKRKNVQIKENPVGLIWGFGENFYELINYFEAFDMRHIIGVELFARRIRTAAHYLSRSGFTQDQVTLLQASIDQLKGKVDDSSVDFMFAMSVMPHDRIDYLPMAREIARVLQPGGVSFIGGDIMSYLFPSVMDAFSQQDGRAFEFAGGVMFIKEEQPQSTTVDAAMLRDDPDRNLQGNLLYSYSGRHWLRDDELVAYFLNRFYSERKKIKNIGEVGLGDNAKEPAPTFHDFGLKTYVFNPLGVFEEDYTFLAIDKSADIVDSLRQDIKTKQEKDPSLEYLDHTVVQQGSYAQLVEFAEKEGPFQLIKTANTMYYVDKLEERRQNRQYIEQALEVGGILMEHDVNMTIWQQKQDDGKLIPVRVVFRSDADFMLNDEARKAVLNHLLNRYNDFNDTAVEGSYHKAVRGLIDAVRLTRAWIDGMDASGDPGQSLPVNDSQAFEAVHSYLMDGLTGKLDAETLASMSDIATRNEASFEGEVVHSLTFRLIEDQKYFFDEFDYNIDQAMLIRSWIKDGLVRGLMSHDAQTVESALKGLAKVDERELMLEVVEEVLTQRGFSLGFSREPTSLDDPLTVRLSDPEGQVTDIFTLSRQKEIIYLDDIYLPDQYQRQRLMPVILAWLSAHPVFSQQFSGQAIGVLITYRGMARAWQRSAWLSPQVHQLGETLHWELAGTLPRWVDTQAQPTDDLAMMTGKTDPEITARWAVAQKPIAAAYLKNAVALESLGVAFDRQGINRISLKLSDVFLKYYGSKYGDAQGLSARIGNYIDESDDIDTRIAQLWAKRQFTNEQIPYAVSEVVSDLYRILDQSAEQNDARFFAWKIGSKTFSDFIAVSPDTFNEQVPFEFEKGLINARIIDLASGPDATRFFINLSNANTYVFVDNRHELEGFLGQAAFEVGAEDFIQVRRADVTAIKSVFKPTESYDLIRMRDVDGWINPVEEPFLSVMMDHLKPGGRISLEYSSNEEGPRVYDAERWILPRLQEMTADETLWDQETRSIRWSTMEIDLDGYFFTKRPTTDRAMLEMDALARRELFQIMTEQLFEDMIAEIAEKQTGDVYALTTDKLVALAQKAVQTQSVVDLDAISETLGTEAGNTLAGQLKNIEQYISISDFSQFVASRPELPILARMLPGSDRVYMTLHHPADIYSEMIDMREGLNQVEAALTSILIKTKNTIDLISQRTRLTERLKATSLEDLGLELFSVYDAPLQMKQHNFPMEKMKLRQVVLNSVLMSLSGLRSQYQFVDQQRQDSFASINSLESLKDFLEQYQAGVQGVHAQFQKLRRLAPIQISKIISYDKEQGFFLDLDKIDQQTEGWQRMFFDRPQNLFVKRRWLELFSQRADTLRSAPNLNLHSEPAVHLQRTYQGRDLDLVFYPEEYSRGTIDVLEKQVLPQILDKDLSEVLFVVERPPFTGEMASPEYTLIKEMGQRLGIDVDEQTLSGNDSFMIAMLADIDIRLAALAYLFRGNMMFQNVLSDEDKSFQSWHVMEMMMDVFSRYGLREMYGMNYNDFLNYIEQEYNGKMRQDQDSPIANIFDLMRGQTPQSIRQNAQQQLMEVFFNMQQKANGLIKIKFDELLKANPGKKSVVVLSHLGRSGVFEEGYKPDTDISRFYQTNRPAFKAVNDRLQHGRDYLHIVGYQDGSMDILDQQQRYLPAYLLDDELNTRRERDLDLETRFDQTMTPARKTAINLAFKYFYTPVLSDEVSWTFKFEPVYPARGIQAIAREFYRLVNQGPSENTAEDFRLFHFQLDRLIQNEDMRVEYPDLSAENINQLKRHLRGTVRLFHKINKREGEYKTQFLSTVLTDSVRAIERQTLDGTDFAMLGQQEVGEIVYDYDEVVAYVEKVVMAKGTSDRDLIGRTKGQILFEVIERSEGLVQKVIDQIDAHFLDYDVQKIAREFGHSVTAILSYAVENAFDAYYAQRYLDQNKETPLTLRIAVAFDEADNIYIRLISNGMTIRMFDQIKSQLVRIGGFGVGQSAMTAWARDWGGKFGVHDRQKFYGAREEQGAVFQLKIPKWSLLGRIPPADEMQTTEDAAMLLSDRQTLARPMISDGTYNAMTYPQLQSVINEFSDLLRDPRSFLFKDVQKKFEHPEKGPKFDDYTAYLTNLGKELGVGGEVMYNPFGGFDPYTNFRLNPEATDVISVGWNRFGSMQDLSLFLINQASAFDLWSNFSGFDYMRYYQMINRNFRLKGPGGVALARILTHLRGDIKNIAFFHVNDDGQFVFGNEVSVVSGVDNRNAVIEFVDPLDNRLKRFWYIQSELNENDPGFRSFVQQLEFQTMIIKAPRSSEFDPHNTKRSNFINYQQTVIIPAQNNNATVVHDETDHREEETHEPYRIWQAGRQPSRVELQKGFNFGYSNKYVFSGQAEDLLDLSSPDILILAQKLASLAVIKDAVYKYRQILRDDYQVANYRTPPVMQELLDVRGETSIIFILNRLDRILENWDKEMVNYKKILRKYANPVRDTLMEHRDRLSSLMEQSSPDLNVAGFDLNDIRQKLIEHLTTYQNIVEENIGQEGAIGGVPLSTERDDIESFETFSTAAPLFRRAADRLNMWRRRHQVEIFSDALASRLEPVIIKMTGIVRLLESRVYSTDSAMLTDINTVGRLVTSQTVNNFDQVKRNIFGDKIDLWLDGLRSRGNFSELKRKQIVEDLWQRADFKKMILSTQSDDLGVALVRYLVDQEIPLGSKSIKFFMEDLKAVVYKDLLKEIKPVNMPAEDFIDFITALAMPQVQSRLNALDFKLLSDADKIMELFNIVLEHADLNINEKYATQLYSALPQQVSRSVTRREIKDNLFNISNINQIRVLLKEPEMQDLLNSDEFMTLGKTEKFDILFKEANDRLNFTISRMAFYSVLPFALTRILTKRFLAEREAVDNYPVSPLKNVLLGNTALDRSQIRQSLFGERIDQWLADNKTATADQQVVRAAVLSVIENLKDELLSMSPAEVRVAVIKHFTENNIMMGSSELLPFSSVFKRIAPKEFKRSWATVTMNVEDFVRITAYIAEDSFQSYVNSVGFHRIPLSERLPAIARHIQQHVPLSESINLEQLHKVLLPRISDTLRKTDVLQIERLTLEQYEDIQAAIARRDTQEFLTSEAFLTLDKETRLVEIALFLHHNNVILKNMPLHVLYTALPDNLLRQDFLFSDLKLEGNRYGVFKNELMKIKGRVEHVTQVRNLLAQERVADFLNDPELFDQDPEDRLILLFEEMRRVSDDSGLLFDLTDLLTSFYNYLPYRLSDNVTKDNIPMIEGTMHSFVQLRRGLAAENISALIQSDGFQIAGKADKMENLMTRLRHGGFISDTVRSNRVFRALPYELKQTILKSDAAGADTSIDNASLTRADQGDTPVGGIDFNPEFMEIRRQGPGVDIPVPENPNGWNDVEIDGLTPFIFNIVPVPNIQMLLGERKKEQSQKISKL